jgi:hypothetical protein
MRKLFLIFVLGMARAEECFVVKNCITSSSLIKTTRPDDALGCLRDCQQQIGCTWWTRDDWIDICALLTDCQQPPDNPCGDCITGQVTCDKFICGITGLCQVFLIAIFVHIGIGKVGKLFSNQGNPLF